MKNIKKYVKEYIRIFTLIFLLAIPIAIYIYTFGVTISSDHARWAEMGSAMSGIYAILLSVFTLIVLYKQNKLQKLVIEQNYAQACVEDFNRYLNEINNKLLSEYTAGVTFKSELISKFSDISGRDTSECCLLDFAKKLNENKNFAENWSFLYALISGFKKYKNTTFEHYYTSSTLKAISTLGCACCVALDNFCNIHSKGQLKFNEFTRD